MAPIQNFFLASMEPYEAIKRDKTVHDHLFIAIRLNNPVAKASSSLQVNKLMLSRVNHLTGMDQVTKPHARMLKHFL